MQKIDNDNDICVICLNSTNCDKKTAFFCQCRVNVHNTCYDLYYWENQCKCCICKEVDYNYFLRKLTSQYKRMHLFATNLEKYNCSCSLSRLQLNEKFIIIYLKQAKKAYLCYIPFMLLLADIKDKLIDKIDQLPQNKLNKRISESLHMMKDNNCQLIIE